MKKALSILLAICLVVCMVPLSASAATTQGTTISAADYHSGVVDKNGDLWMWGEYNGAFLVGTGSPSRTPVKVMSNVKYIETSSVATMVIKNDNTLWAWGNNVYEQLGNGGKGDGKDPLYGGITQSKPVYITDNVASVDMSYAQTFIVKTDGSLWTCGTNEGGVLGDGTTKNSSVPKKVMTGVKKACISDRGMAVALKTDGSLWTWGYNFFGGLGRGNFVDDPTPQKVMEDVEDIFAEEYVMVAIKNDASLWAWGYALGRFSSIGEGQVTEGHSEEYVTKPTKIMDDVVTADFSSSHYAVIKSDSSLWMWGENYQGQLGNNGEGNSTTSIIVGGGDPYIDVSQSTPVKIMDNVSEVSCGNSNTIIRKNDGSIWVCGSNIWGQLGISSVKTYITTFQKLTGITGAASANIPPKPTVAGFSDVYEGDYFADAVVWAVENDITSGTSATAFSPNSSCTRAQAVTFLWRAAGSPNVSGDADFSDVADTAYYADAVKWAVQNGITQGTGNGKFSPNATCNRAQIVTFMYRAEGSPAISGNTGFNDVDSNDYYNAAVEWAVQNGITQGTGSGKFSPDNNCVRAQIVTFLYRAYA